MLLHYIASVALFGVVVHSYSVPDNLQAIYDSHKSGQCSNTLASGFDAGDGANSMSYCGDISNTIFLHSSTNGGEYADMDIDCDGANLGEGKCANDPSGQSQTAFKDTVQQYDAGIDDLDANVHPYVVFGNEGGSPSFNPQSFGVEPLSVMAVVCGGQLHYGIWGDTNGGTLVGEASISLADLCFPDEGLDGDHGHTDKDVLYIAFMGSGAVPGADGADWDAANAAAFEDSIKGLGDQLVADL